MAYTRENLEFAIIRSHLRVELVLGLLSFAPQLDFAQLALRIDIFRRQRFFNLSRVHSPLHFSNVDDFAGDLRTSLLLDSHENFAKGTRAEQPICDDVRLLEILFNGISAVKNQKSELVLPPFRTPALHRSMKSASVDVGF